MWSDLLNALALVCVIEGIIPFINPAGFRRIMLLANGLDDMTLRFIGLTCMLIGIGILYLVR